MIVTSWFLLYYLVNNFKQQAWFKLKKSKHISLILLLPYMIPYFNELFTFLANEFLGGVCLGKLRVKDTPPSLELWWLMLSWSKAASHNSHIVLLFTISWLSTCFDTWRTVQAERKLDWEEGEGNWGKVKRMPLAAHFYEYLRTPLKKRL